MCINIILFRFTWITVYYSTWILKINFKCLRSSFCVGSLRDRSMLKIKPRVVIDYILICPWLYFFWKILDRFFLHPFFFSLCKTVWVQCSNLQGDGKYFTIYQEFCLWVGCNQKMYIYLDAWKHFFRVNLLEIGSWLAYKTTNKLNL